MNCLIRIIIKKLKNRKKSRNINTKTNLNLNLNLNLKEDLRIILFSNESQKIKTLCFQDKEYHKKMIESFSQFLKKHDNNKRFLGFSYKGSMLAIGIGNLFAIQELMKHSFQSNDQLYYCTKNIESLMKFEIGVGSAVVDKGKITAHASFIPIQYSGLFMSIVINQILLSGFVLYKFWELNNTLIKLKNLINKFIIRYEATILGEILSAERRLMEIEEELKASQYFTNDMIVRFSFVENTIRSYLERYLILYRHSSENPQEFLDDNYSIKENFDDIFILLKLSILDLKIEFIKINIYFQENPNYIERSKERFLNKIDEYKNIWDEIGRVIEAISYIKSNKKPDIKFKYLKNRKKEYEYILKELERMKTPIKNHIQMAIEESDRLKESLSGNYSDYGIVYFKPNENQEYVYLIDINEFINFYNHSSFNTNTKP